MPNWDCYPNDLELNIIANWAIKQQQDLVELLSYVRDLWAYTGWGWSEEESNQKEALEEHGHYRRYSLSTAGWSGNESLIEALEKNHVFWTFCWYSSRRGGHYEFRVRNKQIDKG